MLRFAPALGTGGPRSVLAVVTQDGYTRAQPVVAHFRAPPVRRPPPIGALHLQRKGKTLRIRFRPATGAFRYLIHVNATGGLSTQRMTSQLVVVLRGVRPGAAISVSVRGVNIRGSRGFRIWAKDAAAAVRRVQRQRFAVRGTEATSAASAFQTPTVSATGTGLHARSMGRRLVADRDAVAPRWTRAAWRDVMVAMATKLTNTDRYPATPQQLVEMMRTRDYWTEKYGSFSATGLDIKEFDWTGEGLTIRSQRQVPADLPGFAKKIIGDTTVVNQGEIWTPDGDGWAGELNVEIERVPGGMSGWMRIELVGDAESDWSLEYTIKVGVPLVGGKLEGVMKRETQADLKREFAFNTQWLAAH